MNTCLLLNVWIGHNGHFDHQAQQITATFSKKKKMKSRTLFTTSSLANNFVFEINQKKT